jgi:hypothetical protein
MRCCNERKSNQKRNQMKKQNNNKQQLRFNSVSKESSCTHVCYTPYSRCNNTSYLLKFCHLSILHFLRDCKNIAIKMHNVFLYSQSCLAPFIFFLTLFQFFFFSFFFSYFFFLLHKIIRVGVTVLVHRLFFRHINKHISRAQNFR